MAFPLLADQPSQPLTVAELDRLGPELWRPDQVDLRPARWIWLPSQRTLPNTFVLFRREFHIDQAPRRAKGWITADSRYRLTINGQRVQWGPAPCDPRQLDVDAVDLTPYLRAGDNVIGVEVLFYGIGDGTWAAGKPGLLFHATLELDNGRRKTIVSDESWRARLDRAHRPGQSKRWFLRALQEEFDAQLHPFGWDTSEAKLDDAWVPAMALQCGSDKPPSCSNYPGNDSMDQTDPAQCALRRRQIPALKEMTISAQRLAESGPMDWLRDPADWFEFRMPNSYRVVREKTAQPRSAGGWSFPATATDRQAVWATYEFPEQLVGWPCFTIDAPAGTIVEILPQESHASDGPPWLDTHFFAWTRFICREGVNHFESFDYESLRWLQLHVRNAHGPVTIRDVGVRRRQFAWPHEPHIRCSEAALQRLFNAAVNTLRNSAQETCVDGMGRERQQYSGDGGHQLHAIRYAFGETRLPARFLRTFSEGMTPQGYFLDCWPAYDRLARVMQKQIGGAYWGPLLDHGVGFNFDCWYHWMQTGDLESLREPYPRLLQFATYLASVRDKDGLLPVEHLGLPRCGSTTSPIDSSGTSNAPSISTWLPCFSMPWPPWPEPLAMTREPGRPTSLAARSSRPRYGGSGARSGVCSSTICLGCRRRRQPDYATAPWPRRFSSTSAPRGIPPRRSGPWWNVLPSWACRIHAMPTGGTGPWRRLAAPR